MNFLKKKLKPLTSGFNQSAINSNQRGGNSGKNLEDDLYDEYVVEAPPHPSELLALGVNESEIDINDPDKLRELYRKAKAEGKDKKTNSVLLARERQKEEIEEKKCTREEWKFFDSLTSRVEQVVKESQKNLDHWRESSAVSELTEPEYEIRHTPDEVFRPVTAAKLEKGANEWINFEESAKRLDDDETKSGKGEAAPAEDSLVDEFGCPRQRRASSSVNVVVNEILEDFGIDLRTAEQRSKAQLKLKEEQKTQARAGPSQTTATSSSQAAEIKSDSVQIKARPRPRPRNAKEEQEEPVGITEADPFDTSFVAAVGVETTSPTTSAIESGPEEPQAKSAAVDPFDTSYVNL